MAKVHIFSTLVISSLISACSQSPPCVIDSGSRATSAGCLIAQGNTLLVIQDFNDRLSVPGGSSRSNESASCTAFRETWEETGLLVQPKELLTVFDTGFHLYRCQVPLGNQAIKPLSTEVKNVFWFASDEFENYQWRFAERSEWFRQWFDQQADD